MAETYDPKTIQLQGRDYLEVAQRVLWLRREHPDAQIITDITYHDPGEGFVLVRAVVTIPNGGTATGHGTAKRGGRGPAAERWVEFAETRAIGRACAALGYGTLAALDEDSDPADAPADARRAQPPQEPRQHAQATPNTPKPINAARLSAGRARESVEPLPTGIVINPGLVLAGRAYRAAAAQAGFETREAQDQYAREQYPGRRLDSLTEDEWHALELKCRAMYSDVPAPEEAPIF